MAKKEQEQTTDMIPVVAEAKDIKSLIYVVRGQQVMLDSDLAMEEFTVISTSVGKWSSRSIYV